MTGRRAVGPWRFYRGERQAFDALWVALNSATAGDGRTFEGTLGLLSILTGRHVTEIRGRLKRMAAAGVVADGVPEVPIQPWVTFTLRLGRSPAEAAEGG